MKTFAPLFAAWAVGSALADPPPAPADAPQARDVEVMFEALDRNHDQQLSKTEAGRKHGLRQRFRGIDADSDGYLSRAEFEARPSAERFE